MSRIQLHDLTFEPYLSESTIRTRVREIGDELAQTYAGERPLFMCLLRGAFVFAADLLRACPLHADITFVRLASYQGTRSTGQLDVFLPPDPDEVAGRHVVLVEDIVDSGNTLHRFLPMVQELKPASVRVVTLLHKPDATVREVPLDHVGFSIPDVFVVGYGLDYDGAGRGLTGIYRLVEE